MKIHPLDRYLPGILASVAALSPAIQPDQFECKGEKKLCWLAFGMLYFLLVVAFATQAYAQCPSYLNVNTTPKLNLALVPDHVAPGSGAFQLTVNGTSFDSSAFVMWNGSLRNTTRLSSSQVVADISAADVAQAGTANVTVTNSNSFPSDTQYFSISTPHSAAQWTRTDYPMGTQPERQAVADFNSDGILDIVSIDPSRQTRLSPRRHQPLRPHGNAPAVGAGKAGHLRWAGAAHKVMQVRALHWVIIWARKDGQAYHMNP